jgi:hypothetical protein
VLKQLSDAKLAYSQIKKEAAYYRNTWLEDVATARIADGNTSIAQEIKNLILREKQRNDARQINYALKSSTRRGLGSIEILCNDKWVELTTRSEIESALLLKLEKRFNQASQTPFCSEPLLQLMGPMGNSQAAKEVLEGNFQTPQQIDFGRLSLFVISRRRSISLVGSVYAKKRQLAPRGLPFHIPKPMVHLDFSQT